VHARRGDRDAYRPLQSPWSATAAIDEVVDGLLSLAPFDSLYIADLDAIERRGDHAAQITRLRARHPDLDLWVDAGIATRAQFDAVACRGTVVLGSESLDDAALDALAGTAPRWYDARREPVLSIDFRDGRMLGPERLLAMPRSWPQRLIAMSLRRVGSGAGPDLELAQRLQALAPGARVHLAGGVRGASDLATARAQGYAGALVATCLHDGRLGAAEIAALHRRD